LRRDNSIRNVTVNLVSQVLSIIMSFICRTVFIQTLGEKYLGVDGLFGNILSLLALAELGIGSTIIYHMYLPLAQNDQRKLGALMALFKKTYRIIGLVIGAIGLILTPFYHYFIDSSVSIPHLTLIYLLYVFNSVITYFYSCQQCIITADQKGYIVTVYRYGFCIAQNILQILILLLTHNFILYFCLQILFSFFTNFFLAKKAGKMYPFLHQYRNEKLSAQDKAEIFKNVKAMFMHRFGAVIVNGTDNLVISALFGVVSVGLYSNYYMITSKLTDFTSQIFDGITASVGNLGVEESDKRSYRIFQITNFAGFWIFSFCSICLLCLFNPFIELWVGAKMLLPTNVMVLIVLNFYATGMRQATLTFKNSFGLFWYDRYNAVAEAAINLVCSIVLANKIGLAGVFLGTLISTLTTDLWVEPLVLYRHGFHRSPAPYFLWYVLYTALAASAGVVTWYCCSLIPGSGILQFAAKLVICLIVPNALFLIIFFRSKNFQDLIEVVKLPDLLKRHAKRS
jgi:O-antigen/teichoic acid export membrane protein